MKHIDLSKPNKKTGLAKSMVSQESNSFGDQMLTFKEQVKEGKITYYRVIGNAFRTEGDWMQVSEMKKYAKGMLARAHRAEVA